MKRKFRRNAGLILAAIMITAAAVPAPAEGSAAGKTEYTISVSASSYEGDLHKHNYTAYPIFTGDVSTENKEEILSSIHWSEAVTEAGRTAVLSAFAGLEPGDPLHHSVFSDDLYAEDGFLEFLEKNKENPGTARRVAKSLLADKAVNLTGGGMKLEWTEGEPGSYQTTAAAGYYLIVDEKAELGRGDAYSDYLVQISGDTAIIPKVSAPSLDKTVFDNQDDTASGGDGYTENGNKEGFYETADHQINETFQFKLNALLPAEDYLAAYESYKLVFHDTMSKGVAYEGSGAGKLMVTVKTGSGKAVTLADTDYKAAPEEAADGKGPTELTVTIEDLFQLKTASGTEGRTAGTLIKEAFAGKTAVEVEVTYSAHLTEDAETADRSGSLAGNQNKAYLEYTNEPNHEGEGEPSAGKTLEDTVYVFTYELPNRKVDGKDREKPLSGAKFRLYDAEKDGNEIKLEKKNDGCYYPIENQADGTGAEMESGGNGFFHIKGLDAGTYWLEEIKAPAGYNKEEERIKIEIRAANHAEKEDKTGASVTFELYLADSAENLADRIDIMNSKGITLPKTGGSGIGIFCAAGAVLVLAALLLLVARKMKN